MGGWYGYFLEPHNAVVKSVGDLMGISVTDNDISVSHRMPQSK